MRGLMSGEPVLPLQNAEGGVGMAGEQLAGDREAEDAAADHDDVGVLGWLAQGRPRLRRD